MKKGFVILLLALAVVVLISPGLIGRIAEQSMDENLEFAATESDLVTIDIKDQRPRRSKRPTRP